MNSTLALVMSVLLFSCSQFRGRNAEVSLPHDLKEAVHSSSRSPENVERDEFQHPGQTLEFFGIKPHMTVLEVSPGGGYYAEILAPYLAREGQYVIVIPRLPPNPPKFMIKQEQKLQEILLRHQEVQAKTKIIPFEPLNKRNSTKPKFADMVIAVNRVHNWDATNSTDFAFKFFHEVLKPGGTLGIVQHRAPRGRKINRRSGYLTEDTVINMARKAGFKLLAKSEINANPRDTADHPGGVWALPPTYRHGQKNRDKYESIGESDRMTLKFVKVKK